MSWSNENKNYMRVDESWQVRVCMRVFEQRRSVCEVVSEAWQVLVNCLLLIVFTDFFLRRSGWSCVSYYWNLGQRNCSTYNGR